jgi:hypothetical protein
VEPDDDRFSRRQIVGGLGVGLAATVQGSRKYWRVVSFWFILTGLVCLHLLVFILILRNFPDFRVIWYVPIVILEAGIFGGVYDLLLAH